MCPKANKYKNAIGIIKACGLNIKGDKKLMEQVKQIENTIVLALEKQIPKKPKTKTETIGFLNGEEIKSNFYKCPCCKRYLGAYEEKYKHCPTCGQALDWSDTE